MPSRMDDRQIHLQEVDTARVREMKHRLAGRTPAPPGWHWTSDRNGHVQIRRLSRPTRIPTKPTLAARVRRALVDLYVYFTGPSAW